jgi:hypothetical protein
LQHGHQPLELRNLPAQCRDVAAVLRGGLARRRVTDRTSRRESRAISCLSMAPRFGMGSLRRRGASLEAQSTARRDCPSADRDRGTYGAGATTLTDVLRGVARRTPSRR